MSEKEANMKSAGAATARRLYTRTLPLFIASFLMTIATVLYFITPTNKNDPIYLLTTNIGNEIKSWGVILAGFAFLYGYISVVILHSRRLYRRREAKSRLYGSTIFLGVFILFATIILTVKGGVTSSIIGLLNVYILSYIDSGMKTDWVFLPYLNFKLMRLTSSTAIVMFVPYVIYALRSSPMICVAFPPIIAIGDWINFIPFNATNRAATACAGISSVLFGLRALIMKEPGLVELEV